MKTFEFCAHCGDQFFAEDVRRTENGPLCVRCIERGAKTIARKQQEFLGGCKMLKSDYLVFDTNTAEVETANFTEEEALMNAIYFSVVNGKQYGVAKIIARTEKKKKDWKLYKRDKTLITIKQSFKTSEFKPKGEE